MEELQTKPDKIPSKRRRPQSPYRRRPAGSWAAIAALLLSGCAVALSPDLTIKELRHTAWGPGQGAPLGGAVALAQTKDGYLWIAGPSGLFRFDGIAFERIELPHDRRLSSLSLMSTFASRDGGLWLGFTFGGVARLKDGRWQVFSVADGLPPSTPWQFAETADGTLWVVTSNDLARFDGTRWKSVGSQMGLSPSGNPILFVDSQGTMWAGGGQNSLSFLRSGEHRFRTQAVAVPLPWQGSGMTESSTGTVWLDTGFELVPVAQNPPPGRPASASRGDLVFDLDGTLWASVNGLRRLTHPERAAPGAPVRTEAISDAYIDADGLTSRTVFAFQVDREGNVWVGTANGLDRFSEPRLMAPLQSPENLKIVPTIVAAGVAPADEAGGIWVTNGIDAVVRYQNGRMGAPIIKQKVESLLYGDGTAWFGGQGALWRERRGRLELIATPKPDLNTQALVLDKSGGLWVSLSSNGPFRFKDGTWTQYGGIATLPRAWSIAMARDRHDRLWFSYADGTVAMLDGARVSIYGPQQGLQIGNVMAIYSGQIVDWFGGEFGLARFDGERFRSVQSAPELPLEGITGIVATPDGDLWLNGRSGIVHIAAAELARSRLDATHRVRGESFGASDGVVGSAAALRPLPSAIAAGDGKLWFATSSGIYGLDPARRAHNRVPPPVLIRGLTVAGRNIEPTPGLTLPAYTTAVRFDYLGLSLTAAEKVRYRHRLETVDNDWREATAARQALYTNLRPGRYTFQVIAANNDGVWNESGASLTFSIPPAFVQTGWFIALCVAGGASVVLALVRLRVRQVRRRLEERMEERLNERTRISRELHDSLLQSFQGLMLRLQAVRRVLPPGDAAKSLDSAMLVGDQAISEGRDAVQSLRSPSMQGRDLAPSLSALGSELGAGMDAESLPEYRVVVQGRPRELMSGIADEVYRIAREAVGNAYQHARARHIDAVVNFSDTNLSIRVRDDGVGMDPRILESGRRPGHWGLLGMRERSERTGAHLSVHSELRAGTTVELRIPAQLAYAQLSASVYSRVSARFSAVVKKMMRQRVQ